MCEAQGLRGEAGERRHGWMGAGDWSVKSGFESCVRRRSGGLAWETRRRGLGVTSTIAVLQSETKIRQAFVDTSVRLKL